MDVHVSSDVADFGNDDTVTQSLLNILAELFSVLATANKPTLDLVPLLPSAGPCMLYPHRISCVILDYNSDHHSNERRAIVFIRNCMT